MSDRSYIPLRIPAVLLHVGDERCADTAGLLLGNPPGLHQLGPHLLAVLPIAGDPGDVEEAVRIAQRLRRHGPAGLTVIVLPGKVRIGPEGIAAEPEPLLDDLEHQRPASLAGGQVHLPGRAASRLESRWSTERSSTCETAAGSHIPLFQLAGPRPDAVPWHTARLMGRSLDYVPRVVVERELMEHAAAPVLRVTGPLGCGKTRTLWRTLGPGANPGAPHLSIALRSPRTGFDLASELLRELLHLTGIRNGGYDPWRALARLGLEGYGEWLLGDREQPEGVDLPGLIARALELWKDSTGSPAPLRLVFDDLQTASAADLQLLEALTADPRARRNARIVLVGRKRTRGPASWTALPEVEVPLLTAAQSTALAAGLFRGLLMPAEVQQRLAETTARCPFALEESLARMIQQRQLRRHYGNFFYSGNRDDDFEPSFRFIQHREAEVSALGESIPARLLALAETPVPALELASASLFLGVEMAPHWEIPFLAADVFHRAPSAWGPGIDLACPAFARALAQTVMPEVVPSLRQVLGERLVAASDPRALWQAYSLLSGSAQAVPSILELAREGASDAPPARILEGLKRELEGHRQRGGDPATEIQLLWILLPLARRLNRLEGLEAEIDRALEITAGEPRKYLAFASLKAELDLQKSRLTESEETLRKALKMVLKTDPARQAVLLLQLGQILARQERRKEARAVFEQLLEAFQKLGSTQLVATCLFHLGNVALHERRLADALALHQRALEIRRREENLKTLGASLSALGSVSLAQGRFSEALAFYREAAEVLERHGEEGEESFALMGIGRTLSLLGDATGAARALRRALVLREPRGDVIGEAIARLAVAANFLDLNNVDAALDEARHAHFDLSLLPELSLLGDAEQLLGRIALRQKQFDTARQHIATALEIHRRHGDANAALVDQGWQLEQALVQRDGALTVHLCAQLDSALQHHDPTQHGVSLDFRLYRGLEGLRGTRRLDAADPLYYLSRAYEELMQKAAPLESQLRHRYLFSIPENAAILDAAAANRLVPVG
jgi:tetratricopeptide (TPR) repeat protein